MSESCPKAFLKIVPAGENRGRGRLWLQRRVWFGLWPPVSLEGIWTSSCRAWWVTMTGLGYQLLTRGCRSHRLFYSKKCVSGWWLWVLVSSDRYSFFFFPSYKLQAMYLTSLSLSFLTSKMGIMLCAMRIKWNYLCQSEAKPLIPSKS